MKRFILVALLLPLAGCSLTARIDRIEQGHQEKVARLEARYEQQINRKRSNNAEFVRRLRSHLDE